MMKTTGEISTIKIAVFFAAFFAFFLLFAPFAQAACSPPYSGNFVHYGTFSACTDAGRNYCISDGSGGAYGYDSTNVGTGCTSSANACGATNGTCNEQGSCDPPAVPYTVGDYCASPENECGSINEGEITNACTGACSVSTPATPYTVGATCTSAANNCGATNSGTITNACTGACSASAPANVPNLGTACNRNVCGGTGVLQCDAAGTGSECSAAAPTIPVNYGNNCLACNNVGECNSGTIACDGNCSASAPADVTLTASLSANPTSGTTSTDFIMTATLGGTAMGNVNLELLCNGTDNTAGPVNVGDVASYTFATPCEYNAAATYTPKIKAIRQTLSASGTTSITVTGPPDTTPPTTSVSSVAGDTSVPYWDKTNNSSTDIVVSGETNMLCRWGTTDVVWSSMANNCSVSGTDATCSLGSLTQASHTRYVSCKDAAGHEQTIAQNLDVTFGVDWTAPAASYVSPTPLAGSDQSPPFTVYASGGDSGGSNLTSCWFAVFDTSNNATRTQAFTCSGTSFTSQSFTVEAADCSTPGENTCYVGVYARDKAENAINTNRLFSINPVLTYPANTWQRLWYANPSVLNFEDFSPASYLGENAISDIDRDWGGDPLYATNAPNTDNGGNKIGFRASRTYNLTGPYTITIGADDGIKLFTNGEIDPLKNLLPGGAWQNDHSYNDNIHKVRLEPSGSTKFEIRYRENAGNARISFSYAPGFTGATDFECRYGTTCLNDPQGWLGCGPRVMGDGYCYYNSSTTCGTDPVPTGCYTGGWCTYQDRCIVLPGQACTAQGCVEGTPPNVTVNTISGQWYKGNSLLDVDATDNVALQNIKYQIDSYTNDNAGTQVTSDGISNLTVSGTSVTTDWKIAAADWSGLSEGSHTIYVKAIDTSGSCKGCDGSKSFTIKKDTVAPSITIEEVKRNSPDLKVVTNNWLKAGIYEISMSVADPGGSGADTTFRAVTIKSLIDGREYSPSLTMYNKFDVWVGPPDDPLNDCVDQYQENCRVLITVRDNAGNLTTYPLYLNIDYTAPTAQ